MSKEHTYSESLLAGITVELIKGIAELKQKYPEQKTIAQKHAYKQINALETIAQTVHAQILPRFSNYKMPSLTELLGMVQSLNTLYNLRNEFHTRKHTLYLDIVKEFPALIKKARKNHKTTKSICEQLIKELALKKKALFENAALIPGEPLDELFAEIMTQINTAHEHDEIDLKNSAGITAFEEILRKKLFKKTTENDNEQTNEPINVAEQKIEELLEIEPGKTNIIIAEPMMFEFSELLVRIIAQVPEPVEPLISFLNPLALSVDFTGTAARLLMMALFEATYRVQYVASTVPEKTSRVYKLTTYTKEVPNGDTTEIDVNVRLPEIAKQYQDSLLVQFQQYFTENAQTSYVQGLLLRGKLLSELIELESKSIDDAVNGYFAQNTPKKSTLTTNAVTTLKQTLSSLEQNKKLLEQNLALQQQLQEKADTYAKTPAGHLLKNHPDLFKQLEAHKSKKIDLGFANQPLPLLLVAPVGEKNERIEVLSQRKHLEQLIKQHQASLTENHALLQKEITQHTEQQQKLINGARSELISTQKERALEITAKSKTFNNTLAQINREHQSLPQVSADTKQLEELIQSKQSLLQKGAMLFKDVSQQLTQFEFSAILPAEFKQFDTNHQTQTTLTQESQAAISALRLLLNNIKHTQQELAREVHALELLMEKNRSEAQFSQVMQLANPTTMRQHITALTQKINDNDTVIKPRLIRELSEIATVIKEKTEELEKIKQTISSKQKTVIQENKKITETIQALSERVKKSALLATLPEEQDLISDAQLTQKFIDNALNKIEELTKKPTSNPRFAEETQYLNSVFNLLKQHEEELEIPFKAIDELSKKSKINTGSPLKGFNYLLSFIGLAAQNSEFNAFREQQDDVLNIVGNKLSSLFKSQTENKVSPREENFKTKFGILTNAIQAKLRTLNEQNTDENNEREQLGALNEIFLNLAPELAENFSQRATCESEISAQQSLETQCSELLAQKTEEQRLKTKELEELIQEQAAFPIDCELLEQSIKLVGQIQTHQQQIQNLVGAAFTLDDAQLYQQIIALKKGHSDLQSAVAQFALAVKQQGKQVAFSGNLNALTQLLNATQSSLATNIKSKLDPRDLEESLAKFSSDLTDLEYRHAKKTEPFLNILSNYHEIMALINLKNEFIARFKTQATVIKDESFNQSLLKLQQAQHNLQEQSKKLANVLIKDALSTHQELLRKTKVFQDTGRQETPDLQRQNVVCINELQALLPMLPTAEHFDAKDPSFSKQHLATLRSQRQKITKQLAQSQTANQCLLERIKERNTIVNTVLIGKIDAYIMARKNLSQIKKGFVDDSECFTFLNELRAKLLSYASTGDSAPILSIIERDKERFSGLYFHAVLNKITTELFDLDQKIPQNYNQEPPMAEAIGVRHHRAQAILARQEANNSAYVEAIKTLYSLIDDMTQKWSATTPLATKLRQDIDQFVVGHAQSIPNAEAYTKFKMHFMARLHSEDEVLSTHRSAWKAYIANFVIGIATLGIALGLKLAYSKWSEGNYALFFSKTARQNHTHLMQDVVNNVALEVKC